MVSQCDSATTFKLAPFTSSNSLLIDYDLDDYKTGKLTLGTAARYSKLAVFGASGSGGKTIAYTLTYADNSTSTGSLYIGDWFSNATNVAVMEHSRARFRTNSPEGNDDSWVLDPSTLSRTDGANIYQSNISGVDSTKQLVSISFAGTSADAGNGGTAIFAVSGTAVPEPSAVSLLGLGAGGLIAYAWRKRK